MEPIQYPKHSMQHGNIHNNGNQGTSRIRLARAGSDKIKKVFIKNRDYNGNNIG